MFSFSFAVRLANPSLPEDWKLIFSVREPVFIVGQNCPYDEEVDCFEKVSQHAIALLTDGSKAIGTLRWRWAGGGWKIERVAVLEEFRGSGIGKELVNFAIEQIGERCEHERDADFVSGEMEMRVKPRIYLHSQEYAIPFYEKLGFYCIGDVFLEVGIRHRTMHLN
jgi:predicted GNAT family N-acyltransferase